MLKIDVWANNQVAPPAADANRTSNRAFDLEAWLNGVLSVAELNVVGHYDLIGNASHLVRSGTACAVGIGSLLQIDKCSDLRFVPFEPPLTIASYLVWRKISPAFSRPRRVPEPLEWNVTKGQSLCHIQRSLFLP